MYNSYPRGYTYIAWNNVDPQKSDVEKGIWAPHRLFGDKLVRQAMTHLVDRELYCQKIFYGYYVPTTGPFGNKSKYSDPTIEPWPFDTARALELLREAGWEDSDGDLILDKVIDGEKVKFSFTLLLPQGDQDTEAFLSIVQQDMRKAGVKMNIRKIEWNSFQKLTDEKNFDAMSMGWSGTLRPDPTPIWHSSSARPGGFNMIGFRSDEVDELCLKGISTMDDDERIAYFQRMHQILHDEQPYTFMIEPKGSLVARNARLKVQKSPITGKDYFEYYSGFAYWYIPEKLQRPGLR